MRALMCLIAFAAGSAQAEPVLSEVSGNWAGATEAGFFFRAELTQAGDAARLRIWNDLSGVPTGGDAQFDNPEIASGAFATLQELQTLNLPTATILQVVTAYADEEAEGRIMLQIQYLDNQFTVIGYSHSAQMYGESGTPATFV